LAELTDIAARAAELLWGPGLLLLLLGAGAYFTVGSGFFPVRRAGFVWRATFGAMLGGGRRERGGVSPFAAMSTALGATVGTGNITGVAAAVAAGGAGAVFWMWAGAALGMMTKFAEAALAVRYRVTDGDVKRGGPMYYMERGLRMRGLAVLYAVLCAGASFGVGNMVQANSAAAAAQAAFGFPLWAAGAALSLLTASVLFAGANAVARAACALVPVMALGYTAGCLWLLARHADAVLPACGEIFGQAFSLRALGGGAFGHMVRTGVSRGAFSNEAGMGSAAIAHASSSEDDPARQGCWGIVEVFIDTMVVCTMTALVLIVSGAAKNGGDGALAAMAAFTGEFGAAGGWFLASALFLFALATLIGWAYYGESALRYLTGGKEAVLIVYRALYAAAAVFGASASLPLVWSVSDVLNALMAFPNLAAVAALSPEVFRAAREGAREDEVASRAEKCYHIRIGKPQNVKRRQEPW